MKKSFLLVIFVAVACLVTVAQQPATPKKFGETDFLSKFSPLPDKYNEQNDLRNKKPAPFQYIREADVVSSWVTWRIIDLNEKINLPLYYPTSEIEGRVSLVNVLLKGIEEGKITAYDPRSDENGDFKTPMTFKDVEESFGATTQKQRVRDLETGEMIEKLITIKIRPEQVKQILVKEVWFFEKNTSTLQVRILGLCPIRFYSPEATPDLITKNKVFWIYYPEVREILSNNLCYNVSNDAKAYSFDEIFVSRYFDSYIIQQSNVYNNRPISSYASGREAMMESKRVENSIRNYEQDLWEY